MINIELVGREGVATNNQNDFIIGYCNSHTLNQTSISHCSYAFLIGNENQRSIVLLCKRDTLPNGVMAVHSQLLREFRNGQAKIIRAVNISNFWHQRQYDSNSRFNYFPASAQLCKTIEVSLVRSKNTKLVDSAFLKQVLKKPFLCKIGQLITINLQQPDICAGFNKHSLDGTVKKANKHRTAGSLNQLYGDPYIFIIVKSAQLEKEEEYFIVDFESRSELKFTDYPINMKIQRTLSAVNGLVKDQLQLNNAIYQTDVFQPISQKFVQWLSNDKPIQFCVIESSKNLGKRLHLKQVCCEKGYNYCESDCGILSSQQKLEKQLQKALYYAPTVILIRNFSSLRRLISIHQTADIDKHLEQYWIGLVKQLRSQKQYMGIDFQVVIIISVESLIDFPYLRTTCDDLIEFSYKYSEEIGHLLIQQYCSELSEDQRIELSGLFKRVPWRQIEKVLLNQVGFEATKQQIESLSRTEVLSNVQVRVEDVGGMESVLEEIAKTITIPQRFPEIFDELVRPRRGVLFYGPPGTGKTMMAKCVASECKMNFISVKGTTSNRPEMLNMYIGESEKNIRDLFARAKLHAPCIVFFDELDALAPARGNRSDSNQVMDRIVAQFLTEIDQLGDQVFVIGATNRPDLLDTSLLTPGRFDRLIYLGIKEDDQSRLKILKAQTRSVNLDEDVDFMRLLEEVPRTFTGADFQGLTSAALLNASKRIINKINEEYDEQIHRSFAEYLEQIRQSQPKIMIKHQDFVDALPLVRPSVTQTDLAKYQELRQKFSAQ